MSKLSIEARNAALKTIGLMAADGYLRIYEGIQPAEPEIPVSDAKLLAELRFKHVAFKEPINGEMTANILLKDDDAKAKGKPVWYRMFRADGFTAIQDGIIGSDKEKICDMLLNVSVIEKHAEVYVDTFTIAMI